jgi:hypothetical protein
MMVLDPIKTVLCLVTIPLLAEPSNIEICSCGDVVLRQVSYFALEEVVVSVNITVDLLQRLLYIGFTGRACLIVATVEETIYVGVARAVELIVERQVIFAPGPGHRYRGFEEAEMSADGRSRLRDGSPTASRD